MKSSQINTTMSNEPIKGIKKEWSEPPPKKYLESQMEYDRAYWGFLEMAIDKSKADFLDRDSPDNDNLHNWSTNER